MQRQISEDSMSEKMYSVDGTVPVKKDSGVKTENDDPEINAMAVKLKTRFRKMIANSSQVHTLPNVFINLADMAVSSVAPLVSKDLEDIESVKGRYGWKAIGKNNVPYLTRIVGNDREYFISVRIAESQILGKRLNLLHPDIYKCTAVRAYRVTNAEGALLDHMNRDHADLAYGTNHVFSSELVVRIDDVQELSAFMKMCSDKLKLKVRRGVDAISKCGFIKMDGGSVLPYCVKDEMKYVPVFYFEGNGSIDPQDFLQDVSVTIDDWPWAYLKFCCLVQGIHKELYAGDSCVVISLDYLRNHFPPETTFEDYWPTRVADCQLLTKSDNTRRVWFRVPPSATVSTAISSEGISPALRPLPAPTPMPWNPLSVPPLSNIQMGLQQSSRQRLPSIPPWVRNGYSAAFRNFDNSSIQIHPLQQEHSSENSGRLLNTDHGNASRTSMPILAGTPCEIIDLSSPPSSPTPSSSLEPTRITQVLSRQNLGDIEALNIIQIPERAGASAKDWQRTDAYKIQKVTLENMTFYCINAREYSRSNMDLLVTLYDIVRTLAPKIDEWTCAKMLNHLKTTLYTGNSEQKALLQKHGRIRPLGGPTMNNEARPMVFISALAKVIHQFLRMTNKDTTTPLQPGKRRHPNQSDHS